MKKETQELWNNKFGIRIFEGYGATETSPILATNTPMENKIGTVGKFLPSISYRVENVPGVNNGGRLFVKGPNVMLGYLLADNQGTLKELPDNWYDTGDIVSVDNDGFISILGRAKRFAKIAGEMVSLTQIENEISSINSGKLCAVVSVNDDKKGEQLVLVTEDKSIDRSKIVDHFKKHGISELGIPRTIMFRENIPLLGTGKINYTELQVIVESCSIGTSGKG